MNHATLGTARHTALSAESSHWPRQLPPSPTGDPAGADARSRAGDAAAEDLTRLEQEIEGLRRRLLTQPVIEQAKGLLIGLYGIDADTAFTVLVRWSQHGNTKLHLLATELVAAVSSPGGPPHAALQRFIDDLPKGRNYPAS